MFDIYNNLENIEWTNTWIEGCTNNNEKHILLIGDSVAREFRSSLSKYSKKILISLALRALLMTQDFITYLNHSSKKTILSIPKYI